MVRWVLQEKKIHSFFYATVSCSVRPSYLINAGYEGFIGIISTMPFNHYAKIKHILEQQPAGWYIKRIDKPTMAKMFNGEVRKYDHYYRLYDHKNEPIKYGKFQQLERLAKIVNIAATPIVDEVSTTPTKVKRVPTP